MKSNATSDIGTWQHRKEEAGNSNFSGSDQIKIGRKQLNNLDGNGAIWLIGYEQTIKLLICRLIEKG